MKAGKTLLLSIFAFALTGLIFPDAGAEQQGFPKNAAQIIRKSMNFIRDFAGEAGQSVPPGVLENSAGVVIIPDVTRVAFFAGGRQGTGVLLAHDQTQWSLPVFASISGGNLGAQIGISSTDLLLVFRNRKIVSELQRGGRLDFGLDFGLDLTIATGPVGGAADLIAVDADVLAYKRIGDVYAGLSLSRGLLSTDPEMTYAYYEANKPAARGYYEEDRGETLLNDLLSLDETVIIPNVPRGAMRLKRTMDRLSSEPIIQ